MSHTYTCPKSATGRHYLQQVGMDTSHLRCRYCPLEEHRHPWGLEDAMKTNNVHLFNHTITEYLPPVAKTRYGRRYAAEVVGEW